MRSFVLILIGICLPLLAVAESSVTPMAMPLVTPAATFSTSTNATSTNTSTNAVTPDNAVAEGLETITPAASTAPLVLKNTATKESNQNLQKSLMRNFIGLMIVMGVLLLLVTLYKRTHLYKNFHEQPMRIVLTLALAPKQKLAVVELFGGYSLIAISEKNVNLIQVLQPTQVMALESYLATKKKALLVPRSSNANEVSQDEKMGFENLLKKILNNSGPQV